MLDFSEQKIILPDFISDHAVFQANKPVRLWGYTAAPAFVSARICNARGMIIAQGQSFSMANGKFELQLPACPYSAAPHVLQIQTEEACREIHDVIFGDVWLLGGQSNMVMPVGDLETPAVIEALHAEPNEQLRFFSNTLRDDASFIQGDNMAGRWILADPKSVQPISLVGYGMLKTLQKRTGRPMGGIVNAIGGTMIRAWMKDGAYYGSKVLPAAHMNICGAVWYQGESDGAPASPDYGCYERALEEMIRDYWTIWGGTPFPFLIVQLPQSFYYGDRPGGPRLFDYESVRLAQTRLLDNMAGESVYLICALDSNPNARERISIHADNKVGMWQRLAEAALDAEKREKTPAPYTGARLADVQKLGHMLFLHFTDVGEGLFTADGQPPRGFCLAQRDGGALFPEAKITGKDTVALTRPAQAPPGAEIHYQLELTDHYPWDKEFAKDVKIFAAPNLVNGYGVPVMSFQRML